MSASGDAPEQLARKPSAMQGSEAKYGYGVAAALVLLAVVNLAVRHGKGAPAHPQTALQIVGLLAALAGAALVRTNHRFIAPFGLLVAALLVTAPGGPDSVRALHSLGVFLPLGYAFVLMQRQRKATTSQARARREAAPPRSGRASRSRKPEPAPAGPQASRRYTPPKPKRTRR